MSSKPTIEELEDMMDDAEGKTIEIQPNGEIRVVDNKCLNCANLETQLVKSKAACDLADEVIAGLEEKVSDAEDTVAAATPQEWERICISIDYPDDEAGICFQIGSSESNPFGWGSTLWEAFSKAAQHPEVRAAREAGE